MKKLFLSLALLAALTAPSFAQVRFHVNVNLGAPPVYVAPPEYPDYQAAPVYYPPQYVYPYRHYTPVRWRRHHYEDNRREDNQRGNHGEGQGRGYGNQRH